MAQNSTAPPFETPISVLLAHHHTLLREGIACILASGGFSVLDQVETVAALRESIAVHQPDLVLLEWEIPDGGAEAIESVVELVKESGEGALAILTRPQPQEALMSAMRSRVDGYLSVNMTSEEFLDAVRMIARGDVIVSRDMAAEFKEELATETASDIKDELSDRELEVLSLVSRGATNREIAQSLTITQNTVKAHLRRILEKLDLRNRQHAAAYAVQEGLVDAVVVLEDSTNPPEPAEPAS
ncbi:MAG: LuxR C-terminal-related transcriptional regulator [Dehalococcoidia bacterium]